MSLFILTFVNEGIIITNVSILIYVEFSIVVLLLQVSLGLHGKDLISMARDETSVNTEYGR